MAVNAQEGQAEALLESMSASIAGLEKFEVQGDAYSDRRLLEGQIIANGMQLIMRVQRPENLRLTAKTAENTKEIYFTEGELTLFSETDNFYGQTEVPEDIESAMYVAVNELNIDAPLLDFIAADVNGELVADAEQIDYFGMNLVRGRMHHHIGIRYPDIDFQIWIGAEGAPLPGKTSITYKWEAGSPRSVAFLNWNVDPDIPSSALVFQPPEGAARIPILRE